MTDTSLGLPARHWSAAALRFNTLPALYLHDSWYETLPHGALVRRLAALPQAQPEVSHYLLRAFGLEAAYCAEFASHWARLALLDGALLEQVFLYLGLALRADELRREIQGERLRLLKEAIGPQAWRFVIRCMPLLGTLPAFDCEPKAATPNERFLRIGMAFCATHLAAFGPALTRRMELKLPASWSGCLSTGTRDQAGASAAPSPLLMQLLAELPSTWLPLFA